ncbi:MAG: hypothetical protein ABJM06_09030 [Gilvibacter sp.]
MKSYILLFPLFFFLQTGSCSDDSSGDDGGPLNDNFVSFLGETNEASGGCNVESTSDAEFFCTYAGGYTSGGESFTIAVSHRGVCRTATFAMGDNANESGTAQFILSIATSGVSSATYYGFTGTVNVTDTGIQSSIEFSGTVLNVATGDEEAIEGFIACAL